MRWYRRAPRSSFHAEPRSRGSSDRGGRRISDQLPSVPSRMITLSFGARPCSWQDRFQGSFGAAGGVERRLPGRACHCPGANGGKWRAPHRNPTGHPAPRQGVGARVEIPRPTPHRGKDVLSQSLKACGERIAARDPDRQAAEIHVPIALINRCNALGTAEIVRVACHQWERLHRVSRGRSATKPGTSRRGERAPGRLRRPRSPCRTLWAVLFRISCPVAGADRPWYRRGTGGPRPVLARRGVQLNRGAPRFFAASRCSRRVWPPETCRKRLAGMFGAVIRDRSARSRRASPPSA